MKKYWNLNVVPTIILIMFTPFLVGFGQSDALVRLLIALAVIVIISLICREIVCWYWKINERINQQNEIIEGS